MSHIQASRPNAARSRSRRQSDSTLVATDSSTSETATSSSLIQLNPLISSESTSGIDKDEKCWICFESRQDEEGNAPTHGIWRSPCKCALVAHEDCLLDWIADMEKNPDNAGKGIKCPQCKTPIQLKQQQSAIVNLGKGLEKRARQAMPFLCIAGLGSAVFVSTTVYGVNAIYLICGTEQANAILLAAGTREFEWTWRLGVGLPIIPIVLIGARTRFFDATLPILPFIFFCHNEPFHITFPPSPAITLALLPYARAVYEGAYRKLLLPYEKKWNTEIGPTEAMNEDDGGGVGGLEVVVGDVEEVNEDAPEAAQQNNQPPQANAANGNANANGNRNAGWRVERELVLGADTANLVVGALLFPGVVASMGSILGRIPAIRRLLPARFHRNVLGGCLFVFLKDFFTLYYKYKRAQQRKTRSILDYQKPSPRTTKARAR